MPAGIGYGNAKKIKVAEKTKKAVAKKAVAKQDGYVRLPADPALRGKGRLGRKLKKQVKKYRELKASKRHSREKGRT